MVTWKVSTSGGEVQGGEWGGNKSYAKQMAIFNILGNERGVQLCFRISFYNIKAKFFLITHVSFWKICCYLLY